MKRLIEKTVFCGLVTAWRLATVPTSRSPPCVKATTDGVVRPPSLFSTTVGSPPSSTAMHEFVVPRSIPIVLPMVVLPAPVLARKSQRDRSRSAGHADPRAHAQQRALAARGSSRVTGAPPVAKQVQVQLELLARRREGE